MGMYDDIRIHRKAVAHVYKIEQEYIQAQTKSLNCEMDMYLVTINSCLHKYDYEKKYYEPCRISKTVDVVFRDGDVMHQMSLEFFNGTLIEVTLL